MINQNQQRQMTLVITSTTKSAHSYPSFFLFLFLNIISFSSLLSLSPVGTAHVTASSVAVLSPLNLFSILNPMSTPVSMPLRQDLSFLLCHTCHVVIFHIHDNHDPNMPRGDGCSCFIGRNEKQRFINKSMDFSIKQKPMSEIKRKLTKVSNKQTTFNFKEQR